MRTKVIAVKEKPRINVAVKDSILTLGKLKAAYFVIYESIANNSFAGVAMGISIMEKELDKAIDKIIITRKEYLEIKTFVELIDANAYDGSSEALLQMADRIMEKLIHLEYRLMESWRNRHGR
jgi:hypothetical protein